MNTESTGLFRLPPELQLEILLAADLDSIFNLRTTCKTLQNLVDAYQRTIGNNHANRDFLNPYAKRLLNFRRPGFLSAGQKNNIVKTLCYHGGGLFGDLADIFNLIGPFEVRGPSVIGYTRYYEYLDRGYAPKKTPPTGSKNQRLFPLSPDPNIFGLRELQVMKQQFDGIIFKHLKFLSKAEFNLATSHFDPDGKPILERERPWHSLPFPEWTQKWIEFNTNPKAPSECEITPGFLFRVQRALYNIFISLSCIHAVTFDEFRQYPLNCSVYRFDNAKYGSSSTDAYLEDYYPSRFTLDEYELYRVMPTIEEHQNALTIATALWTNIHYSPDTAVRFYPMPTKDFLGTHLLALRSRIQNGIKQWSTATRKSQSFGQNPTTEDEGQTSIGRLGLTREEARLLNAYAIDPSRSWHSLLDGKFFEDSKILKKMYQLGELAGPPSLEQRLKINDDGQLTDVIDEQKLLFGEYIGEFWDDERKTWIPRLMRTRNMDTIQLQSQNSFEDETTLLDLESDLVVSAPNGY